MTEFAIRVRRIRMKAGGADVTLIRNERAEQGGEDHRGALVGNARTVAEQATDDAPLVGYLLIGIYDDGKTSVGFRYDHNSKNAIPRTLLPSWIAEVIRREMISAAEAQDVFNDMFQWVDG